MEQLILYFILFIFGLAGGSFVNVLVYRIENEMIFTWARSQCPKCKMYIRWYDNIPILSYIFLKGRCRGCKKKISLRYPLVEFSVAVIFVLLMYFLNLPMISDFNIIYIDIAALFELLLIILFYLAIVSIISAIFIIDYKHFIIPDKLVFPGAFIAFTANIIIDIYNQNAFLNLSESYTLKGLFGVLIAAGFFYFLVAVSKEKWMGYGDVKYGIFMGLLLGYPNILIGLFFSFLIGAAVGIILMNLKLKKMNSEIPFGPFLCIGTLLAMIIAENVIYFINNNNFTLL